MDPISRSIRDYVFYFRGVERPACDNDVRFRVAQGGGNQKRAQRLNFNLARGSKFFKMFIFTIFGSWLNTGSKAVYKNHLIEEFDRNFVVYKNCF